MILLHLDVDSGNDLILHLFVLYKSLFALLVGYTVSTLYVGYTIARERDG